MLRLALLGDSIAYGVGADRSEHTLAPRLVRDLAAIGLRAESQVYAVPGARSADLGAQVDRCRGWRPDLAVIVIGANDLTHFVPAPTAAAQLRAAVRALSADGVQVVLAPAPDLSSVPHVPPAARALVQAVSRQLRQLQSEVTLAEGGRVADVDSATARAFTTDRSLFSADRFHPSSAGYAAIAAALSPPVRRAAQERAAADESAAL